MFLKDFRDLRINKIVAATFVVATILFSCKDELPITEPIDPEKVPTHIILEMSLEQSSAAKTKMKVYAPIMENFSKSNPPYEIFSKGINVKAFTSDGLLETEITAKKARHINSPDKEQWEAYGDETDTLYWDKSNKRIFTHCFVKLKSPTIFMQGYGMESDELARNATILRPFDSYGIVKRDSTEVIYVDTVNFIGPILKNK